MNARLFFTIVFACALASTAAVIATKLIDKDASPAGPVSGAIAGTATAILVSQRKAKKGKAPEESSD